MTLSEPETTPVAAGIARALAAEGVAVAFGLMGEDTADVITSLDDVETRFVAARHENVAVNMAAGYHRATGELGVAILTRGPGLSNSVTALATAVIERRGVLVVTGECPTLGRTGADPKSLLDQRAVAASIGLAYHAPETAAELAGCLRAAVADARAGRPAMLAVPIDVLAGSAGWADVEDPDAPVARPPSRGLAPDQLREVAGLLQEAERPLILGGWGAVAAGAGDALRRLAESADAYLGTTLLAKDLFRDHPHELGIVGGFSGRASREVLEEVDCVVAFGATLSPFTTAQGALFQRIPVVQVDVDPAAFNGTLGDVRGRVGDARAVAEQLLAVIETEPAGAVAERLAGIEIGALDTEDVSRGTEIDPRTLTRELDRLLPAGRVVVSDGGHCLGFPAMHLRVAHPEDYYQPQAFGSIAMGLGSAIGVALGRPDRTTVLFVGDGALSMVLGDLETLAREEIPVVVVVLDDRAYGAERHFLDLVGRPHHHANFADLDFEAVARSLGIESVTIRDAGDLTRHAGIVAGAGDRPLLLDCKIVPELRSPWIAEF